SLHATVFAQRAAAPAPAPSPRTPASMTLPELVREEKDVATTANAFRDGILPPRELADRHAALQAEIQKRVANDPVTMAEQIHSLDQARAVVAQEQALLPGLSGPEREVHAHYLAIAQGL